MDQTKQKGLAEECNQKLHHVGHKDDLCLHQILFGERGVDVRETFKTTIPLEPQRLQARKFFFAKF